MLTSQHNKVDRIIYPNCTFVLRRSHNSMYPHRWSTWNQGRLSQPHEALLPPTPKIAKLLAAQPVTRNSPNFTEPKKDSLLCSQQHVCSLSWARWVQSTFYPFLPFLLRPILILFSSLCLVFQGEIMTKGRTAFKFKLRYKLLERNKTIKSSTRLLSKPN